MKFKGTFTNLFAISTTTALIFSSGCITDPVSPALEFNEVEHEVAFNFSHGKHLISGIFPNADTDFTSPGDQYATATFLDYWTDDDWELSEFADALIYTLISGYYFSYDEDHLRVHLRYDDKEYLMGVQERYTYNLLSAGSSPDGERTTVDAAAHFFDPNEITPGTTIYFDLYVGDRGPYTSSVVVQPIPTISGLDDDSEIGYTDSFELSWGDPQNIQSTIIDQTVFGCVPNPLVTPQNWADFSSEQISYSTQLTYELFDTAANLESSFLQLVSALDEENSLKSDIASGVLPEGTLCSVHTAARTSGSNKVLSPEISQKSSIGAFAKDSTISFFRL